MFPFREISRPAYRFELRNVPNISLKYVGVDQVIWESNKFAAVEVIGIDISKEKLEWVFSL